MYNDNLINDSLRNLTKRTNQRESRTQPSFLTLPLNAISHLAWVHMHSSLPLHAYTSHLTCSRPRVGSLP